MQRLLVAVLLCAATAATSAQDVGLEYRVKAAYLFNFTKFIEWPNGAFVEGRSFSFSICVAGRNPFGPALTTTLAGETAAGLPLAARVVNAGGAAGCHVGQSDLPAAAARALLGPEAILGVSLDAVDQLADLDPAIVDYVAHGPFAATATKPDAGGPVGAEGLAAVRRLSALPLVAIGGIDAGNAGLAIGAGADGVAVVSAIVAAADPRAASRRLRAAVEAARPHQRRERA